MKKIIKRLAAIFVLPILLFLLFGCEEDVSRTPEPDPYSTRAYLFIGNEDYSGKNIISVTISYKGDDLTANDVLEPGYALTPIYFTEQVTGLDVSMTDEDSESYSISNQSIEIGEALFVSYDGTGIITERIDLTDSKSGKFNIFKYQDKDNTSIPFENQF